MMPVDVVSEYEGTLRLRRSARVWILVTNDAALEVAVRLEFLQI